MSVLQQSVSSTNLLPYHPQSSSCGAPVAGSTTATRPLVLTSPAPLRSAVPMLGGSIKSVAPLGAPWDRYLSQGDLDGLASKVSESTSTKGMRNHLLEFCEFSCIGPVTNYTDRPIEQLPDPELWDCLVRASRSHTQPLKVLRVARTSVWVAEETVHDALRMEYRHFEREVPNELRSIEERLGVVPASEHETLDLVYIVLAARRAETNRDLKDGARENAIDDDPVGAYWTPCWVTRSQLMQLVASNTLVGMRTIAEFDPVLAATILTTTGGLPALMDSSMQIVMGCGDPRSGQAAIVGKPEGPWMRALQHLLFIIGAVTARPNGRYPRSFTPQALAKRASRSRATSYAAMKSALKRGLAMADDEGFSAPGGRGCHRLLDRLRDNPRPVTWPIGALRRRRAALERMRVE